MSTFADDHFADSEEEKFEFTVTDPMAYKMSFGQYNGKTLETMFRTSKGRNYAKYLIGWDSIYEEPKANLEAALLIYNDWKRAKVKVSKK